jgi:hypothetical protein
LIWIKLSTSSRDSQLIHDLQKPVMLTVDQGQPHPVPFTWCLTNTCIAGTVADPKMILEMG